MQGDTCRHGIPRRHHTFLRLGRLFTNGTPRIVSRQLTKAVPMNRMSAGHFVTCRTRREQVFLADGTVCLVLAVLAVVVVVECTINAHATVVTVLEVFGPTDAAKATVGAMVRTLFIRHPQVADVAVVFTELDEA